MVNEGNPMRLPEIAAEITKRTGIPVAGIEDAIAAMAGEGGQRQRAADDEPATPAMTFYYEGPLSAFLNRLAARHDLSWRYEAGSIHLTALETRTFVLDIPVGETSVTNTVSSTNQNAGGGSGGGGGEDNTESSSESGVTRTAEYDGWTRVEEAISNLVSEGARMSVSPDARSVTVTAKPFEIRRVADWVADQNARLGQRVRVHVQMVTAEVGTDKGYDINFDALAMQAGEVVTGAALGNLFSTSVVTATSSFSDALDQTPEGGAGAALGWTNDDGDGLGAAAMASIARTNDRVSMDMSNTFITNSGQAYPIQRSNQRRYVESVTIETSEGGNTAAPETASINTGFSMTVTPTVLRDDRVSVAYNLSDSALVALKDFEVQGTRVQLPEIDVTLNSGQTVVAAAYKRTRAARDSGRTGVLGWRDQGELREEVVAILLTPVIVEDSRQITANR